MPRFGGYEVMSHAARAVFGQFTLFALQQTVKKFHEISLANKAIKLL